MNQHSKRAPNIDLQMVNITLRVLTKPKWDKLPQIYKKLGQDYDQRVLPSIVNEVLKGVVVRIFPGCLQWLFNFLIFRSPPQK